MCGEKQRLQAFNDTVQGSPPHVRGKVEALRAAYPMLGITPACAGKSCIFGFCSGNHSDHPRMCGEKSVFSTPLGCPPGSPPHVRGKETAKLASQFWIGITPACAGKSRFYAAAHHTSRDHPRMCGEKTPKALKIKHLNEQVLKFPLTSDRSHRSTDSPSVLDGSLIHPVRNTMPLP